MYYVKITLLASTPRSVYEIKYSPVTTAWGTLFPTMTLLAVITFAYSVISPIINGLAFAAFSLFYFLYKYLFTWVNDQPPSSETGGLFFPKAMNHLFVGLYVKQLCLCALFFLAENEKSKPSAIPEGALMVVLIVFTVSIVHWLVSDFSHVRPRHSSTIPSAMLTAPSTRPYPLPSLIVLIVGSSRKGLTQGDRLLQPLRVSRT